MTFREFIEQSSEKGLMYSEPSEERKPSDGFANSQFLSSIAGRKKSGSAGPPAGGQQPIFMKKKMKKG